MLTPSRTKSGQRIFRPKDLSTVAAIKRLLHEEGYTIAGAVKYLRENGVGEQELPLFSHLSRGVREYRLAEIRQDLEGLLAILNRDPTREA
jgi:DNA-binding transcriptional MerR regulator